MPKPDVRKAFEAVLGEALPAEGADEVLLRHTVAVTTRSLTDRASITSREIGTTGSATKRCSAIGALDVGGTSRTAADGSAKLSLSDYHCLPETTVFAGPINFVATPQSKTPTFLTSVQALTATSQDVAISVFAWDANGNPLKDVSFDWRCFVPWYSVV